MQTLKEFHEEPYAHLAPLLDHLVGYDARVVDLGCGDGAVAEMLAGKRCILDCVDTDAAALQRLAEKDLHPLTIRTHKQDGTAYLRRVSDGTLDAVTACGSLHEMSDHAHKEAWLHDFFQLASEKLSATGRLFVLDYWTNPWSSQEEIYQCLEELGRATGHIHSPDWYYEPDELEWVAMPSGLFLGQGQNYVRLSRTVNDAKLGYVRCFHKWHS